MNFQEVPPRIVSKILICLAVASGSVVVGCSSEVGTSSSSKQQVAESLAKEAEKNSTQKGANGKSVPAPRSIKQKVFGIKGEQAKPE